MFIFLLKLSLLFEKGLNRSKTFLSKYRKPTQKLLSLYKHERMLGIVGDFEAARLAKIETEKMLIQMVEADLAKRKQEGSYNGQFQGKSHFFGYLIS